MKRLRATIDVYVDLDLLEGSEDMTEEELIEGAKGNINLFIDGINQQYMQEESEMSLSDIMQYEVYDDSDEIEIDY